MKPEDYNAKARQKFGETLVDIGVTIFKGIMLLFTVIPMTFIVNNSLAKDQVEFSITDILKFMSSATYLIFLLLLSLAFIIGYFFRKEGLRHIHESEND